MKTIKIKATDGRDGYSGLFNSASIEKFWAIQPFAFTGSLLDAGGFLKSLNKLHAFYRFYDEAGAPSDHDETLDAIEAQIYRAQTIQVVK